MKAPVRTTCTSHCSIPQSRSGADPARHRDTLLVNAPLRDYEQRPRLNDYTLPVLGMAYIATYAQQAGYNVGILDAEAHGLGVQATAAIVNAVRPRWAGMNLLAPTYAMSARIAAALDPQIALMAGGHHAKAMPDRILDDPRMANVRALILGEAEPRVVALLEDERRRAELPGVMWRDPLLGTPAAGIPRQSTATALLAPTSTPCPWSTGPSCRKIRTPRRTGGSRRTSSAAAGAPTTAPSAAPPSAPTPT
ncbi:cobalamin-dependent protein [Streptomyces sp. NPDC002067]